ncbi:MAG: phosphatidylglycerol lysyltransferase domain-containing protein [Syntrophales bacterium]|nr:phosphatidylglycerol lysyltransferase domain-containing protein [Syntrophales bacterium]
MNFKQVAVDDYGILKPFFAGHPYSLCVYSPASLIVWSFRSFKAYYAIEEGRLFIAGEMEDGDTMPHRVPNRHLILPLAQERLSSPAELHRYAERRGFERYWCVPADYMETLDRSELEALFVMEEQKGYEDYVYLTEDLIHLKGNKYSKKRNLINQFTREYLRRGRVEVEEILAKDVAECLQFLDIWCEQHDCDADPESDLACEKNAVITALENMEHLEWKGLLIRVDGRVSAFGIGARLNETTATLNFEKADSEIKGLYQFLDNECAKRLFRPFRYLNKESDMNLPNLAESKQSYNPILRIKSYALTLR